MEKCSNDSIQSNENDESNYINSYSLPYLASLEMGKSLNDSKLEILKSANLCLWYADNAEQILAPVRKNAIPGCKESYIVYQPIGTILSIMPWNFPVWQVIRMGIPAVVLV